MKFTPQISMHYPAYEEVTGISSRRMVTIVTSIVYYHYYYLMANKQFRQLLKTLRMLSNNC